MHMTKRLLLAVAFGVSFPGMPGVGGVGGLHVCVVTHHELHLGPAMPACAAVERDAKQWLADNNDDDAGHDATAAATQREAWTVQLAACGSLAAACAKGFTYILANAPARFSHLDSGARCLRSLHNNTICAFPHSRC